jgi:hypothetical protein
VGFIRHAGNAWECCWDIYGADVYGPFACSVAVNGATDLIRRIGCPKLKRAAPMPGSDPPYVGFRGLMLLSAYLLSSGAEPLSVVDGQGVVASGSAFDA